MTKGDDCPYEDFVCLTLNKVAEGSFKDKTNPFIDDRGYAPLELDLVDLAYHHTEGNRDMAYLIGQEIYRYLKSVEPEIDNWYEGKV